MSGLILKLAPGERVLINGVVIENGDRRSKIAILTPGANILRLKDAIHPDAVNTPVSRLCHICQLVLTGEADRDSGGRQVVTGIAQLSQVFRDPDSQDILAQASDAAMAGDFYRALKKLKLLLPREARLMTMARP